MASKKNKIDKAKEIQDQREDRLCTFKPSTNIMQTKYRSKSRSDQKNTLRNGSSTRTFKTSQCTKETKEKEVQVSVETEHVASSQNIKIMVS